MVHDLSYILNLVFFLFSSVKLVIYCTAVTWSILLSKGDILFLVRVYPLKSIYGPLQQAGRTK